MPDTLVPHVFVVVGATGDLVRRMLLPAPYEVHRRDRGDAASVILGVTRQEKFTDDDFRQIASEALENSADSPNNDAKADIRRWCAERLYFEPADNGPNGYERVAKRIRSLEKDHELPGNRVFYLATPPAAFAEIVAQLDNAKLNDGPGWTRLVVEKPFGRDLESAHELNRSILKSFDESQVYRIDHFLGKETVQNLIVFRFANMLFESAWNRDRIANVQITVAEDLGVENRAGYYERAGALRDMAQNHLTQLLALIAMDAPPRIDADALRSEKLRVLRSIDPIDADDVVFGQYAAGEIDGQSVPGYRDEPGVADDSPTDTYVAMKLSIDNWRWHGVPFFLRTGKRMGRKASEIAVTFRAPPVCLFEPIGPCDVQADVLRLRLQPNEGVSLAFDVKLPGEPLELRQQRLDFRYADVFGDVPPAYETLLADVIAGDQTHFVRADEVEAAWRIYTPVLENRRLPATYTAGSFGPSAADKLVEKYGCVWIAP